MLLPPTGTLSSDEACARLVIKKATLYSYASRGLIRRVSSGRRRFYVAEDVDRIATRSAARRGHGAVASGALRWGEPVLDSSITSIVEGQLRYRGRDVSVLCHDARFEDVCDLLWQSVPGPWPASRRAATVTTSPVWRMVSAMPSLAIADTRRLGASPAQEHVRGRALIASLAGALGAKGGGSIARRLATWLSKPRSETAIDRVLVLCADHELNVSSFASRVAASAGADLYACVGAALYVFSGPKHGAACDRVEALTAEKGSVVRDRLTRGESLPGFGHPLYPQGDPRARLLLELARVGRPRAALDRLLRIVDEAAQLGLHPTVDLGVVAVALSLGAPAGTGGALFALGRVAGWIAHALEQRSTPGLLRPRARYVGE